MNLSFKGSTNVVQLSHFRPILWIPIKCILIFFKEEGYVFQKNQRSITPSSYTLFYFYFFKLLVMNIPVFNFQKMTNVRKGYAYIFSNFITNKKPKIDVCVTCLQCALKESNDLLQSTK